MSSNVELQCANYEGKWKALPALVVYAEPKTQETV